MPPSLASRLRCLRQNWHSQHSHPPLSAITIRVENNTLNRGEEPILSIVQFTYVRYRHPRRPALSKSKHAGSGYNAGMKLLIKPVDGKSV